MKELEYKGKPLAIHQGLCGRSCTPATSSRLCPTVSSLDTARSRYSYCSTDSAKVNTFVGLSGAPSRSRTDASDLSGIVLFQLSYGGTFGHHTTVREQRQW